MNMKINLINYLGEWLTDNFVAAYMSKKKKCKRFQDDHCQKKKKNLSFINFVK